MTEKQQFIQKIREDRSNPVKQEEIKALEDTLMLLGEELNSSNIHFVAEFIQNAEDAGYGQETIEINIRFVIDHNRIIVQNNGRPFNERDVKAICWTAASTKKDTNQIGFMGIGFKSVYKITSFPEIHSNGFHFKITKYIHPEWIDSPLNLSYNDMQNTFVLPLKDAVDNKSLQNLANHFDDIDPTILLFLKKLKIINISNLITKKDQFVRLKHEAENYTKLITSQGIETSWYLITKKVSNNIIEFCANFRNQPIERLQGMNIQIACTIDENNRFKRVEDGRFFVFLPTKQKTGLGFHLQSNFKPTTSRENIDLDRTDNQMILEFAANCLIEQILAWCNEGVHDNDLYELFPLAEEVEKSIAQIFLKEMQLRTTNKALIYTRSKTWKQPQETFLLDKYPDLSDLITPNDLAQTLGEGIDFVYPELTERHIKVVKSLGVQNFDLTHFVKMLENAAWLDSKATDYEWFSQLILFLHSISTDIENANLTERIRAIPLIPEEDGLLIVAREICLPKEQQEHIYALFSDKTDIVAQKLLQTSQDTKLEEALEWLGVNIVDSNCFINQIIIPAFDEELDDNVRFAYLDFVRLNWEKCTQKDNLKRVLKFKTQEANTSDKSITQLMLPTTNGNFDTVMATAPDMWFISDFYLEQQVIANDNFEGLSWQEFLGDLGILQHIDMYRIISLLGHESWLPKMPYDWFCELYYFLSHQDIMLNAIESLHFIPIETKTNQQTTTLTLANISSDTIYLPIYEDQETSYTLFSHQLKLVAKPLLNCIYNHAEKNKLLDFFQWLGISNLQFYEAINRVILPSFEGDDWKILLYDHRFSYLDFVRQYWGKYQDESYLYQSTPKNAQERVSKVLWFHQQQIKTNFYNKVTRLVLSTVYNRDEGLDQLFVNVPNFPVISSSYAHQENEARKKNLFKGPSWDDFFHDLGIIRRTKINRILDILRGSGDWLKEQDVSWFGKLFEFLHDIPKELSTVDLWDKLRALPLIPNDQMDLFPANDEIFLPWYRDTDSYELFKDKSNLVSQKLLNIGNENKIITCIEKLFNVKHLTNYHAINTTILHFFQEADWQALDEEKHFKYLSFVERHWRDYQTSSNSNDVSTLKKSLRFKSRSSGYRSASNLILSNVGQRDNTLELLLADAPDLHFISDEYDISSWRKFLVDLGAIQQLSITQVVNLLSNNDWVAHKTNEWFYQLFIFLDKNRKEGLSDKQVATLKQLKIIPATSKKLYSATENLFLPLENDFEYSYQLFGQQLNLVLVSKELFTGAKNEIFSVLNWLGLEPFTPYQAIQDVIIPILRDNAQTLSHDDYYDYYQYANFIRKYWRDFQGKAHLLDTFDHVLGQLKQLLLFQPLTSTVPLKCASELILTQHYQPKTNLEEKLKNVIPSFNFINSYYYDQEQQEITLKRFSGLSWGEFFGWLRMVNSFDVVRLIDDFILPQFESDYKKDERWLILTDFIRCNFEEYYKATGNVAALQENLWLACGEQDEIHFYRPTELYLSTHYDRDLHLAKTFETLLADHYVSASYLKDDLVSETTQEQNEALQKTWRDFFKTIGVLTYLPIDSEPARTLFEKLLASGGLSHSRAITLIKMLDEHWDSYYKNYPELLIELFQDYRFIPTKDNGVLVKLGAELFISGLTKYVNNRQHIFEINVKLLKPDILNLLKIRSKLTISDSLNLLREAKKQEKPNLEQLKLLYKTLEDLFKAAKPEEREQIQQAFQNEDLIYIANRWCSSKTCFWQSSSLTLIDRYRPFLSSDYNGLKTFFEEQLKIRPCATEEDYLDVLATDLYEIPILEKQSKKDVVQIYQCLENRLQQDEKNNASLVTHYQNQAIWLCHDGQLRTSQEVYINDNPSLHELFKEQIACINIGSESVTAFSELFERFEVDRLSEYETEPVTKPIKSLNNTFEKSWQERIQRLTKVLLRYIFTFEYPEFKNILVKFQNLKPVCVEQAIDVTYCLPHGETQQASRSIYLDLSEKKLYLSQEAVNDPITLSEEIYRSTNGIASVQDFVNFVFSHLNDEETLSNLMARRGLKSWVDVEAKINSLKNGSGEENQENIPQTKIHDSKNDNEINNSEIEDDVEPEEDYDEDEDDFEDESTDDEPEKMDAVQISEALPNSGLEESGDEIEQTAIVETRTYYQDVGEKEDNDETEELTYDGRGSDITTPWEKEGNNETETIAVRQSKPNRRGENLGNYRSTKAQQPSNREPTTRNTGGYVDVSHQSHEIISQDVANYSYDDVIQPKVNWDSEQQSHTSVSYPPSSHENLHPTIWNPDITPNEAEIQSQPFVGIASRKQNRRKLSKGRNALQTRGIRNITNNTSEDILIQANEQLSEDMRTAIGRWGEEYAVKYLIEEFKKDCTNPQTREFDNEVIIEDGGKTVVIIWHNKYGETKAPCDIEVIKTTSKGDEVRTFWEVKSTKTSDLNWFYVSTNEWDLAKMARDKFYFLRVYNAGTKNALILVVPNPVKKWEDGHLQATPIRIEL